MDSGYLSWIKFSHTEERCIPGFGNCAAVNSSSFSTIYNIPVAYLGFMAYGIILLLLLFGKKWTFTQSSSSYLLFGITLIGLLFSIYLTYIQFGILETFCPFCLLSAITTMLLFIISTTLLVKEINK
jgi:uncharacterized membrane protein